jgi:hypothetical protein
MNKKLIFKLVWRGWFIGASTLFTPLFLFVALFGTEVPREMLFSVPLIPVIAALQGVVAGGLVVLGLTIWPPKN